MAVQNRIRQGQFSVSVQQTSDDGYILAAWTESPGNKDVLLRKVSGEPTKTVKTPAVIPTKTTTTDSIQTPTASLTQTRQKSL